jgi:hypothetical protein
LLAHEVPLTPPIMQPSISFSGHPSRYSTELPTGFQPNQPQHFLQPQGFSPTHPGASNRHSQEIPHSPFGAQPSNRLSQEVPQHVQYALQQQWAQQHGYPQNSTFNPNRGSVEIPPGMVFPQHQFQQYPPSNGSQPV